MALTDAQIRTIRADVGSSPSDDDLDDLYSEVGSTTAVALAVLRPRYADALNDRSISLPGVISVGAPPSVTAMATQISRLETQLAAENGTVDTSGLGATSVVAGRRDRVR